MNIIIIISIYVSNAGDVPLIEPWDIAMKFRNVLCVCMNSCAKLVLFELICNVIPQCKHPRHNGL